jgi:hypothetical protein
MRDATLKSLKYADLYERLFDQSSEKASSQDLYNVLAAHTCPEAEKLHPSEKVSKGATPAAHRLCRSAVGLGVWLIWGGSFRT